jgi:hypothetical protein
MATAAGAVILGTATVLDRRQTASAELILKINAMLEEHRYDRISDDIPSPSLSSTTSQKPRKPRVLPARK